MAVNQASAKAMAWIAPQPLPRPSKLQLPISTSSSTVEQLRQELRELQSEVRELRQEKQNGQDGAQSRQVEPAPDTLQDVGLDNSTDDNDFILAQRRGQSYDRNDRGWNWNSNRSPYENQYRYNYGNRGWPPYHSPQSRSLYSGNRYYRYGGTPYYYGGRNSGFNPGFGLSSGLQLGRNLGFWY
jgi:TolA-binding protein